MDFVGRYIQHEVLVFKPKGATPRVILEILDYLSRKALASLAPPVRI
jgi:hypothetical protein